MFSKEIESILSFCSFNFTLSYNLLYLHFFRVSDLVTSYLLSFNTLIVRYRLLI